MLASWNSRYFTLQDGVLSYWAPKNDKSRRDLGDAQLRPANEAELEGLSFVKKVRSAPPPLHPTQTRCAQRAQTPRPAATTGTASDCPRQVLARLQGSAAIELGGRVFGWLAPLFAIRRRRSIKHAHV